MPDCCEPTPFIADRADRNIFQRAYPTRYISSNGTDGYLYTASASMNTKLQQIWIQARRGVWIDEWAVAFHLQPWVNESKKHLLITGLGIHDELDNNYQILIKENLIPTIVPSMEDFRWYYYDNITDIGPSTRLTIGDRPNGNLDLCPNFTAEVTCPSGTEYSIYAGGDPGTTQTSKALLFSNMAGYSIDSRATATTILPNQTCAFCLIYEPKISKEPEYLDKFSLWSSEYYPWIFDSWDHPLSEENYTGVFKIQPNETRAITVDLRRIEGGTLGLRTYSTSLTSDDVHLQPIIHSFASCVKIEWSRDSDTTDQTGFLIHVWEGSYEPLSTETSPVTPKSSKKVLWYFIGAGLALLIVFAIGLILGICWKIGYSKDQPLSTLWRERVFQHSTLFDRRLRNGLKLMCNVKTLKWVPWEHDLHWNLNETRCDCKRQPGVDDVNLGIQFERLAAESQNSGSQQQTNSDSNRSRLFNSPPRNVPNGTNITQLVVGSVAPTATGFIFVGGVTLVSDNGVYILVDTPAARDTKNRNIMLQALQRMDIQPAQIRYLLTTHGHPDHMGQENLFPNAIHLMVGFASNGSSYSPTPLIQGKDSYKLTPSVELWNTPGHTLGDISLIAYNTSCCGTVAVVGDLILTQQDLIDSSLSKQFPPEQPQLNRWSQQRVICASDYIVPGHEPMFRVTNQLRQNAQCQGKRMK
ncbi:unnamed protein product, partial [Mesorhabditis belari]|uniref:Metallo-beta-lactamase domain-containing protein n=1 Tax=Mesorhabditis belari TaxID=2138241 RepID=A0AAF3FLA3_9BILA